MDRIAIILCCVSLACGNASSHSAQGSDDAENDEPLHGNVDWIVELEAPPVGMHLDDAGNAQLVLDGEMTIPPTTSLVRVIAADGRDLDAPVELEQPDATFLRSAAPTHDGLAMLFTPRGATRDGEIELLSGAGSYSRLSPYQLDAVECTAIAIARDGTIRVAGRADREHRMVVVGFAADGTYLWRWGDTGPGAQNYLPTLVAGTDANDIVVWSNNAASPSAALVVHVGGSGEELARKDVSFGLVTIAPKDEGWLLAGAGGSLARLDADLHMDSLVELQTGLDAITARFVATPDGVLLVVYDERDPTALQVRRYDDELQLEAITDVPQPDSDTIADAILAAEIDASGALYLAALAMHGTSDPFFVAQQDGWLARLVP